MGGHVLQSTDPCPVYLELSAVAANGPKDPCGGESAQHFRDAQLPSCCRATIPERHGKNRPPGSGETRSSSCSSDDSEHAWAAGETQYPLPRDPFVLLTTDGGASWRGASHRRRRQRRFRTAFVVRFGGAWRIDRRCGQDVNERPVSFFESETGGDSWALRSTADRAPALRRAPATAEDPNWRIRTAKDGNAYQIENRAGDSWCAGGVIPDRRSANCKIDPAQPAEPG